MEQRLQHLVHRLTVLGYRPHEIKQHRQILRPAAMPT